jgi:hypothetical protein
LQPSEQALVFSGKRAQQYYYQSFTLGGALSLDADSLSLESYTLSLESYTLSLESYTLSLESYTLSLESYTVSLESYTLSLESYTLSLESYTLSLVSHNTMASMIVGSSSASLGQHCIPGIVILTANTRRQQQQGVGGDQGFGAPLLFGVCNPLFMIYTYIYIYIYICHL